MATHGKIDTSELVDLVRDFAEVAIDSFLEEGFFRELPGIKLFSTFYKAGKSIKTHFILQKIISFLNGCSNFSREEAEEFIRSFENKEKANEFGMQLLLFIDNSDSLEKANLIGKLYLLLLKKNFDLKFYLRLCYMINKSFYDDIQYLQCFENRESILTSDNEKVPAVILENLFSYGFISEHGVDGGDAFGKNSGTRYALNEYGMQLKTVLQQ